MVVLETQRKKRHAHKTSIIRRNSEFFKKAFNMIDDRLEADPSNGHLQSRSKSDFMSHSEKCSPSSLKQSSKTFVNELVSMKSQESKFSNAEGSDGNFFSSEDANDKELTNSGDELIEPTLACKYIDARWEALCTQLEDGHDLKPCPTCGRRFNSQAAHRHFPICSRVNDKLSSVKFPKINASRSHSTSHSPAEEQSNESRAEMVKPTPEKPSPDKQSPDKPSPGRAFKLSHGKPNNVPWRILPKQQSRPRPSIFLDKCRSSSKPILQVNSDLVSLENSKRDLKSGYKKSVMFWKKSSKGLQSSVDSWHIPKSKMSNNSLFKSNNCADENKQLNKKKKITLSREIMKIKACERRAFEKPCFDRPRSNVESYSKRSSSRIINGSHFQSMAGNGEQPSDDWDLNTVEKLSSCSSCGLQLHNSILEQHKLLCKRLKIIELKITKDGRKKPEKDYRVLPLGTETDSTINLRTVASVACPCCSNFLEIKHR